MPPDFTDQARALLSALIMYDPEREGSFAATTTDRETVEAALSAAREAGKSEREAEVARLRADIENAVWNLAGCETFASGHGLDEPYAEDLARPALKAVRELALRERTARTSADREGYQRGLAEGDSPALAAGILAVRDLIGDSRGVVGLHRNGDEAPWDDLRTGGRFEEWLIQFDEALKVAEALEREAQPAKAVLECDQCGFSDDDEWWTEQAGKPLSVNDRCPFHYVPHSMSSRAGCDGIMKALEREAGK